VIRDGPSGARGVARQRARASEDRVGGLAERVVFEYPSDGLTAAQGVEITIRASTPASSLPAIGSSSRRSKAGVMPGAGGRQRPCRSC
jgi:hypothetical protein